MKWDHENKDQMFDWYHSSTNLWIQNSDDSQYINLNIHIIEH